MRNFDRQYRLIAGQAGQKGFEIGGGERPLHISFSCERADTETSNTAKITIWNLNDEHIAELEKNDCTVILRAGYGTTMPLVFTGVVSFVSTRINGGDRETNLEIIDTRTELRDTFMSVSFSGSVNCKKLIQLAADEMGVPITYGHNAEFADIPNGYSFVGNASELLSKACQTSGLAWSIDNGILIVKKPDDALTRQGFNLKAESGLIGIPVKIKMASKTDGKSSGGKKGKKDYQSGWEVEYLMNTAINVNDYVHIESKYVTGYFRVYSISINGDNYSGSWTCKAKLLEVKE